MNDLLKQMNRVLLLVLLTLPATLSAAIEIGPFGLSGSGFGDFRSAYYSRGKISNKEPILPLFGKANVTLGPFGYIGGSVWTVSAVSPGGQSANRQNAFHEVDLKPWYGYDWDFGSGWKLVNTVSYQWVLLPGYRTDPPTTHEWHLAQALQNPYVTPYYLWRYAFRGNRWNYIQLGLTRTFPLKYGFVFKPKFWCDFGDERHFVSQYGRPSTDGLMALNLELRLEWWFVDNFGLHAAVQQFDVVSSDGRAALEESSQLQAVTDYTIFTVGLAARF